MPKEDKVTVSDTRTSIFSSARERRLWLWTLVVVLGIYATLGLARTFAGALRDRGLISNGFWLGMLLIGIAIVLMALRMRPSGIEIGVGIGIAGVYLIAMLRMAIPAERSHLIEYSVVAIFIYAALQERVSQGRTVPFPALLAIVLTTLTGVLDETIQFFLPSRVFDLFDILFDFLASVMAVGASVALGWARQLSRKYM